MSTSSDDDWILCDSPAQTSYVKASVYDVDLAARFAPTLQSRRILAAGPGDRIIERFGQAFRWDATRHRTAAQLEPLRLIGDEPMDAALEELQPAPGEDVLEALERAPPGSAAAQLLAGLRVAPAWIDWHLLARGQQVYLRYLPAASLVLFNVSLVGGFSAPKITKVLEQSGYLVGPPKQAMRRLFDTGRLLIDSCAHGPEALQAGGEGWRSAVRVRALHAKVCRPASPKQRRLAVDIPATTASMVNPLHPRPYLRLRDVPAPPRMTPPSRRCGEGCCGGATAAPAPRGTFRPTGCAASRRAPLALALVVPSRAAVYVHPPRPAADAGADQPGGHGRDAAGLLVQRARGRRGDPRRGAAFGGAGGLPAPVAVHGPPDGGGRGAQPVRRCHAPPRNKGPPLQPCFCAPHVVSLTTFQRPPPPRLLARSLAGGMAHAKASLESIILHLLHPDATSVKVRTPTTLRATASVAGLTSV